MEIAFLFQGEEVYRFELPDRTERAVFGFAPADIYSDCTLPIPIITEISIRPISIRPTGQIK